MGNLFSARLEKIENHFTAHLFFNYPINDV